MKYLALILLLFSCNTHPTKQSPAADTLRPATAMADTIAPTSNSGDADETNTEDTAKINAIMLKLLTLPPVHSLDSAIKQATNYKHGASFMVDNSFDDDTTCYRITVGDNSHEDHYATLYRFAVNKQTGAIKVYDVTADSLITIEAWQKMRE